MLSLQFYTPGPSSHRHTLENYFAAAAQHAAISSILLISQRASGPSGAFEWLPSGPRSTPEAAPSRAGVVLAARNLLPRDALQLAPSREGGWAGRGPGRRPDAHRRTRAGRDPERKDFQGLLASWDSLPLEVFVLLEFGLTGAPRCLFWHGAQAFACAGRGSSC